MIESNLAGAGPAPVLEGVDSDEDDLELLDEAFAEGQEGEEDNDLDDLEDEYDVEDDDEEEGSDDPAAEDDLNG